VNNLNSILIEGNLVRDPVSKTTAKGTPLCTFSIASNRYYKQDGVLQKEVSYIDIETWSKTAEYCTKNGEKGRGVRVVGRLKQERWVGTDGSNRSRIAVVAEHIEFRPGFNNSASGQDKLEDGTSLDEGSEAEKGFVPTF
jgi:single-strand DNA-binding protein